MSYQPQVVFVNTDPTGTPADSHVYLINLTSGATWAVVGGSWYQTNKPPTETLPKIVTTAAYSTLSTDRTLILNGAAAQTITLVSPGSGVTQKLSIKNLTGFLVTLTGNVEGSTSFTIPPAQYGIYPSLELIYVGTEATPTWRII